MVTMHIDVQKEARHSLTQDTDVINEINDVPVSASELLFAWLRINERPPQFRDKKGRLTVLMRMFSELPYKIPAVESRLYAMCEIIAADDLPSWAVKDLPNGEVKIADSVWIAAAEEPLTLVDDKPHFELEDFLNTTLLHMECGGNA